MMITLLSLLLTQPAAAGDLREPALDLLGAYEDVPSAEDFRALGEGVVGELMEIGVEAQVPRSRRGRAVSALAFFPEAEVQGYLEARLADASDDSIVRRKAAYALGAGFGAAAVGPLGAALADDDLQLRIAAAGALGALGEPGRGALEGRLDAEPEAAGREAIEKALAADSSDGGAQ